MLSYKFGMIISGEIDRKTNVTIDSDFHLDISM